MKSGNMGKKADMNMDMGKKMDMGLMNTIGLQIDVT
jgi:hypothetical protein